MSTLLLIVFLLFSNGAIPLTDDEKKTTTDAVGQQKYWQKAVGESEIAALNASLKCEDAIAALANFQKAFAMREASTAKLEALLNAHRLAHSCADCEYNPTFSELVRKEAKK